MGQAVYALAGAAFAIATCLALGLLLFRIAPIDCTADEERPLAFFAGAAVLSGIVFALAAAHLAHKGVFVAIGLAAIAAAIRIRTPRPDRLPPLTRAWTLTFAIPASAYFVLYFVNALAPEYSPDGVAYHLGLVQRYARAHGFPAITTNMYANLSQGFGMLQWFAFSIGRHSAAALLHLSFLCALAWSILCYGRRIDRPGAGVCAALFVFTTPVIGIDATVAYNDVALASIMFATFYLVQLAPRSAVPTGLLAGFCFAIKYTGFLAVPFAIFETWRLTRRIRPALIAAAFAALMIAPWLIKNAIILGNPVSPFFNDVFPNPSIHPWFEHDYAASLRKYPGLESYAALPRELTIRGVILGGFFGPAWLLAPVALLSLTTSAGRRLTFAAILFAATYAANVGTRFLIPAAPFLAMAMMLGARRAAPAIALAHVVLSWPWIVPRTADPIAWQLSEFPWRAALRLEPEDQFLRRKNSAYGFARLLEESTPPNATIFSFSQLAEAYTLRNVRVGFQSASNEVLRDTLLTAVIADWKPTGRWRFPIGRTSATAIRVIQTARAPEMWSVTELRIFDADRELPRDPAWRLRAKPNRWDVQLAFDNSPVTRWRTWESLKPGHSIEADFASPRTLDSVVIEGSYDQHGIRLILQTRDPNGRWRTHPAPPVESNDDAIPGGMRHAATLELKSRGITHLAINDEDFGARDFQLNAVRWGIAPLGEWFGTRLYRID